ncbi:MAG: hypothetical protein AB7S36_23085, partial [Planctomycetota bacterium]
MLTMKAPIFAAGLALAACVAGPAVAAPFGRDGTQVAQASPKLTGQAAAKALAGNTLVPIAQPDADSFYLGADGSVKVMGADGKVQGMGAATGWAMAGENLCFSFLPLEQTLNCSVVYVVGDTVTFIGRNDSKSEMRILKGNAK